MSETKKRDKSKDPKKDKEKEKEKDKEKGKDKDRKKSKDKGKDEEGETPKSKPGSRRGSKANLEPVEIPPPNTIAKVCMPHQQKLVYFCDSCQEPVCQQCTALGPHNSQMHRIIDIQTAYRNQARAFQTIIYNSLVPKRDQLSAQIYRLDFRLGEVKQVKTWIERDVRAEMEGMLENIRSLEGNKNIMLRHDIELLQRDIDQINEVINLYSSLTKVGTDPLEFLSRYGQIKELVQISMGKDFKRRIVVECNDFPNDLPRRREKLEKARAFEEVSAFKDQVIEEIAIKNKKRLKQIKKEFEESASEEIEEWSQLADDFIQKLKVYQVVCYYCGCKLSDNTVNTICKANKSSYYPLDFGYTIQAPENEWNKTGRHFFSKPRPDLVKKGTGEYPRSADEVALANSPLKSREARAPYQTFLEVIIQKIYKSCIEKGVKIEKLIESLDTKNTGHISFIALSYLLNEYCSLDQIELTKLKEVLDPLNKNLVPYQDFIEMIREIHEQEAY